MKIFHILLVLMPCWLLASCGGAANVPPQSTPLETAVEPKPMPVVSTPEPEPPPREEPIKRIAPADERKCDIFDQEDGTQMVLTVEHDWFLYVPTSAQVECGTFGGNVTITDGNLKQTIKPLIPQGMTGKQAEKMLREQSVGFIRTNLYQEYRDGKDLAFKEVKLGKYKRPALCAEADLDLKGFPGKVVACVTSKTSAADEVVVHRAIWVGDTASYDPKATPKLVKEVSANWHLYSDTDGFGKILHKW